MKTLKKELTVSNGYLSTDRKPKQDHLFPLLPTAVDIIDAYAVNKVCIDKGLLLPVLSKQKMNEYLKEIAGLCGIDKKLISPYCKAYFRNDRYPVERRSH